MQGGVDFLSPKKTCKKDKEVKGFIITASSFFISKLPTHFFEASVRPDLTFTNFTIYYTTAWGKKEKEGLHVCSRGNTVYISNVGGGAVAKIHTNTFLNMSKSIHSSYLLYKWYYKYYKW